MYFKVYKNIETISAFWKIQKYIVKLFMIIWLVKKKKRLLVCTPGGTQNRWATWECVCHHLSQFQLHPGETFCTDVAIMQFPRFDRVTAASAHRQSSSCGAATFLFY